ncbi:MAG: hypothetical protein RMJ98_00720 [Myxococcales bacterium]|nr:hypothetical protein [Polyangiaceae bacterium]MDW8247808.1 hypothetical protein [Myxococcales bacterium]
MLFHRLLLLLGLAACSAAPPAPPVTSAPAASVATSEPPPERSGWTIMDPRVIRCGIDDRPRNVLGAELPPRPLPALLAEVAAQAPAPLSRPVVQIDMALEPSPQPAQPPLRFTIERDRAMLSGGGALPPQLAAVFESIDPQFDVCSTLAPQDLSEVSLAFDVEFASNGAPLRVLPVGEGEVAPFTRCLQERACQYQTRVPLGQLIRVRVPLRIHRDQPLPPRPLPAAQVRVDVATEMPSNNLAELQLQLRTVLADAARGCGLVPGRAQVRFLMDLVNMQAAPLRRSGRLRRHPSPRTVVEQVRTQLLAGQVPTDVLSCVVEGISGRSLVEVGFSGKRTERMILTWNP